MRSLTGMVPALRGWLAGAQVVLIVPPLAGVDRPSLAAHLLQGAARAAGIDVRVLYANMMFASLVGVSAYQDFLSLPTGELAGERLFAPCAFGAEVSTGLEEPQPRSYLAAVDMKSFQAAVVDWLAAVLCVLDGGEHRIVACTSTFEQTNASIGILVNVKRSFPRVVTILGGANCEGPMAEGVRAVARGVDVLFSGECESVFPTFLREVLDGKPPSAAIIRGHAAPNLDSLPVPDYAEYLEQGEMLLGREYLARNAWLLYETSRGCWWGQKHHCTFCGLNGEVMALRKKSSELVLRELKLLAETTGIRRIFMTDNIMPYDYFRSVIPGLAQSALGLKIFYEQKSNLTLRQVRSLLAAGVTHIQPGIESLSSSLLRRMDKGVSGPQNIRLLRYARATGMVVLWNWLYGFPGDAAKDYAEAIALMSGLHHLPPPSGAFPVSIERFSPYFERPEQYGVSGIYAMKAYRQAFPSSADVEKIAYHFHGQYDSILRTSPRTVRELRAAVKAWSAAWSGGVAPALHVERLGSDGWRIRDTRQAAARREPQLVTEARARVALTGKGNEEDVRWALASNVCARFEGEVLPLATAEPEVFEAMTRAGEAFPEASTRSMFA